MNDTLLVHIADSQADSEELDELTHQLRRELLELDVDNVERLSAGDAPPGTRGLDVAALGALLVTCSTSASAITNLITTVRGWLRRAPAGRTVELTIRDRTLKLSNVSDEQQERLIQEFLSPASQD